MKLIFYCEYIAFFRLYLFRECLLSICDLHLPGQGLTCISCENIWIKENAAVNDPCYTGKSGLERECEPSSICVQSGFYLVMEPGSAKGRYKS